MHAAGTDRLGPGTRLLAALDARRDEVYCQLFEVTAEGVHPLRDVRDMTLGALMEEIRGMRVLVTGEATAKVLGWPGMPDTLGAVTAGAQRCSGARVALVGETLLLAGKADDPSALEPRYIKDFFLRTR